jgi:hypothetical protein
MQAEDIELQMREYWEPEAAPAAIHVMSEWDSYRRVQEGGGAVHACSGLGREATHITARTNWCGIAATAEG